MATARSNSGAKALRGVLTWVGVGVASFGLFSATLYFLGDERPEPAREVPEDEPELPPMDVAARKLDVPEVHEPLPEGPNAERVRIPVEGGAVLEKSEDDKLDEAVAAGFEPPEGLSDKPLPVIPRGVVEVPADPVWLVHLVVPAETVEQVAFRYGVRPPSVRMWNGLKPNASKLKVNSKLKVRAKRIPPQRVEIEYVVKPGDSWWKIGIRYGVDSKELRRTNYDIAQRLVVGQSIRVFVDPVVFEWVAAEDDPDNADKVRPGAVGIGPPQAGRLVNGVLLPPSPYYVLRLPPSSYGTTHAIEVFRRGLVRFEARSEYPRPLILGSMSAKHGGPLTGHRSHQSGRDIDIRLPLDTKYPDWFPVEPKRVDWLATWQLISAMAETKQVVAIFLDYALQKELAAAAKASGATDEERSAFIQWPRGAKAHRGLVRHSPGHEGHLHIRFECGDYEIECVTAGEAE